MPGAALARGASSGEASSSRPPCRRPRTRYQAVHDGRRYRHRHAEKEREIREAVRTEDMAVNPEDEMTLLDSSSFGEPKRPI